QKKGGNIRLFDNDVHHNNYRNFAPKGNIVASVPQGTGIMVLATSNVEIFNNRILQNHSIGTSIVSYYMTELPIKDSLYYPYPTGIYVHDNVYQRDAVRFLGKGRTGLLFKYKLRVGKNVPDIIYAGIIDDKTRNEKGEVKPDAKICLRNNQNATFMNLDAANNFKNRSRDVSKMDCYQAPLKYTTLSMK
ncbi:MAG: hypothetical protein EAZ80_10820, partial [Runella slithyformis]